MILRPPISTLFSYTTLFRSYLDPNRTPNDNILLPRSRNVDGIIDSKIVNLNIVSLISRWIDKIRSEEHTSELQSHSDLVCRLLLEKKKKNEKIYLLVQLQ